MKEIIQNYLDHLEKADYEKLMDLFVPNAMLYLSLNGKQDAKEFYKKLFNDVTKFKIKLINISTDEVNQCGTAHFHLELTLSDSSVKSFDAFDIFEFNDTLDKIIITYVTHSD